MDLQEETDAKVYLATVKYQRKITIDHDVVQVHKVRINTAYSSAF